LSATPYSRERRGGRGVGTNCRREKKGIVGKIGKVQGTRTIGEELNVVNRPKKIKSRFREPRRVMGRILSA